MPRKDATTREDELIQRFGEIEERYRIEGEVKLGEASPEELRELAAIDSELKEIRAARPQEAAV
ncbi:MAG TPA: hypothetical protein VFS30_03145 [Dehalococcoidia bacterium]|nr:hypothetical protein [Dehalococcoidia bacterium]